MQHIFFLSIILSHVNACTTAMRGDGICQTECLNSNYGYDDGDCDSLPWCDPMCPPGYQYNFVCNSNCDTPACNYDNQKCLCAPGCLPSMIGDGYCDPECNKVACRSDDGDCDACTAQTCANGGRCTLDSFGVPKCDCPAGTCDPSCRTLAKPLGTVKAAGSYCGQAWDFCNSTYFGNARAQFCCKNTSAILDYDCTLSQTSNTVLPAGGGPVSSATVKHLF